MARLVSANHDLRVDPADVVDATLRRHDVDHAPESWIQRRLDYTGMASSTQPSDK